MLKLLVQQPSGARALLCALAAVLVAAPSAVAKEPTGDFAIFKQCPRFTEGVGLCIDSQVTGGEVTLDKQTVPIEHTITLQGGIHRNPETEVETFYGALNGETLSKTPETVPGGLAGLVKCDEIEGGGIVEDAARVACETAFENGLTGVNAITELAKPASDIGISKHDLIVEEGPALTLPIKVRLENPLLGSDCYIGSGTDPIVLELTTGTTHPEPPNKAIRGEIGEIRAKDEFEFIEIPENILVNNEFSAPAATGCGGALASVIDPIVNSQIGLPSADGHNTAIQRGNIYEATSVGVVNSEA
jgi:hypothetical protein